MDRQGGQGWGYWQRRGSIIIVHAPSATELEDEVSRSVAAKVTWKGPLNIAAALREPGGGLYFIRASDKPCYIGQTVNFADRLVAHMRSGRCTYAPASAWQVWVGRVQPAVGTSPTAEHARRLRLGVEHAVIRSVINQRTGPTTLLNKMSIRPFKIDGVLRVENSGDLPRVGTATTGNTALGRKVRSGKGSPWRSLIESKHGNVYEWQS